jgi:energy-coupling factor transport system permease protein
MTSGFLQQVEHRSAFSRLDVRVKLVLLLLASTLIFVWQSVFFLGALLVLVLALCGFARVDRKTVLRLFLVLTPAFALILLIQGLWSPVGVTPLTRIPEGVPWLGGRNLFYWEGLVFGLLVCLRIVIPLLAFVLVVMTTDVNELVLGLVKIGVPYRIAFLFSITVRFVPLLMNEMSAIRDSQRLRGIAIESFSLPRKVLTFGRMLVPLVTGALMKAQTLEIALQSRAFSGSANRTFLEAEGQVTSPLDWLLMAAGLAFLAAAIAARLLLGWGGFVA